MKYLEEDAVGAMIMPVVELTEQNLLALLHRLKHADARKYIVDSNCRIAVRVVPTESHDDQSSGGVVIKGKFS